MLEEVFKTEEELDWLAPILFRRAAIAYEQAGLRREAADCWAEAQETGKAVELYLLEEDYVRAAPLLLAAGRYQEALRMYDMWEEVLLQSADYPGPSTDHRVQILLGQSACLLSLKRNGSDTEKARKKYRAVRQLIEEIDAFGEKEKTAGRFSFLAAKYWELLAGYAVIVGRNDLIQLGYENALVRYGEPHNEERVRALRAYIEAVAENRLLVAELETRLAEWDENYFKGR